MSKEFVLITGHGIFPLSSILQVVPVIDTSFDVKVVPPADLEDQFMFTLLKNTSINVEIARTNPTKKNEVEPLTDYGYSRSLSEEFDFTQDEYKSILELSDDDVSEIKGHIKDYTRRLKKILDYNAAVTVIQNNPDLPDYEASLSAIKQSAPSSSTERKQEKTLSKIKALLLERVLNIIENASESDSDDEDYEGKKLIDMINSDDSQDNIEEVADEVLKKFYNKNFNEDYIDFDDTNETATVDNSDDLAFDEGEDWMNESSGDDLTNNDAEESLRQEMETAARQESLRRMANEAVEEAEIIRRSPDTISN